MSMPSRFRKTQYICSDERDLSCLYPEQRRDVDAEAVHIFMSSEAGVLRPTAVASVAC